MGTRRRVAVVLGAVALALAWWVCAGPFRTYAMPPEPDHRETVGSAMPWDSVLRVELATAPVPAAVLDTPPFDPRGWREAFQEATWTGTVVDGEGAPVEGARVHLVPNGRVLLALGYRPHVHLPVAGLFVPPSFRVDEIPLAEMPATTTDAEGRFALSAPHLLVPPAAVDFRIGTPFAVVGVSLDGHAVRVVEAPDPDPQSRRAALEPITMVAETVVVGRVVGDDGAPIDDARVTAHGMLVGHAPDGEMLRHVATLQGLTETSSGPDGRFRLGGLLRGHQRILVRAAGHVPRVLPHDVGAAVHGTPGVSDVGDVALDRGSEIAGRVVDPSGVPLMGVEVFATHTPIRGSRAGCVMDDFREGDDTLPIELLARDELAVQPVATDAEGRFRIQDLADAPHVVYAHGLGREAARMRDVTIGRRDVELVLAREALLDVTLTDVDTGASVEGATIHARRITHVLADDPLLFVSSLGAGCYRVHGVGPIGTSLEVVAPGYVPRTLGIRSVATARATFFADLIPGCVVGGRVAFPDGTPAAGSRVRLGTLLHDRRTEVAAATTDGDGRYRFDSLAPDVYEVRVSRPGWIGSPARAVLDVREHRVDVDVALVPVAELLVRVVTLEGAPLAQRAIQLQALDGTPEPDEHYHTADELGLVTMGGLHAGRYRVRDWHERVHEHVVDLAPGERKEVELVGPAQDRR